jgi:hypothetical protein
MIRIYWWPNYPVKYELTTGVAGLTSCVVVRRNVKEGGGEGEGVDGDQNMVAWRAVERVLKTTPLSIVYWYLFIDI